MNYEDLFSTNWFVLGMHRLFLNFHSFDFIIGETESILIVNTEVVKLCANLLSLDILVLELLRVFLISLYVYFKYGWCGIWS